MAFIVLSYLSVMVSVIVFCVFFIEIPHSNKDIFNTMSSMILTSWAGMIGWVTSQLAKKNEDTKGVTVEGDVNLKK